MGKSVMPSAVTSTKGTLPRSFGSTMFARKSSRYEAAPRSLGQRPGPGTHQARLFHHPPNRQSSSLTTHEHGGHHLTIPHHTSLRIGTLSAILADVATHFEISRDALLKRLFGYAGSDSLAARGGSAVFVIRNSSLGRIIQHLPWNILHSAPYSHLPARPTHSILNIPAPASHNPPHSTMDQTGREKYSGGTAFHRLLR